MIFPVLALSVLIAPSSAEACSVAELRRTDGYQYSVDRIRQFVDSAPVIIRARAREASDVRPISGHAPAWVRFEVLERVRGPDSLAQIDIPGILVARDDFNADAVPYTIVRSAGQRGDCYAREYRLGAEYLLILNSTAVGLSPSWKPLAPFNEQVRGAQDPWLVWVRTAANKSPGGA